MEIQCCALLLLPAATDRYQITHNRSLQANCSSSTVIVLLYLSHSIPFFFSHYLPLYQMDNSSSRRICFTYFAFILRKKANGQKMGGFPSLSLLHIIHFFTCHLSSCPQARWRLLHIVSHHQSFTRKCDFYGTNLSSALFMTRFEEEMTKNSD